MKKDIKNSGFTLIELLLYISVSAIMLLVVFGFTSTLIQSRVKNKTVAEVDGQASHIIQIITQITRNAENITTPSISSSGSSLVLDVINTVDDPTTIDISGGEIRIKEGFGSTVALTNSNVIASNLSFENLSITDTPGIVRIIFTLSHVNPENRNEFEYSKTYYASASLR